MNTNTDLVEREEAMPVVAPEMSLPERMLMLAVEKGMDVSTIERLAALYDKAKEDLAKANFVRALAAFRSEVPEIKRDKLVKTKAKDPAKTAPEYRHATLANITQVCGPVLAKHGLAVTWEPTQEEGGQIKITAVLMHIDGFEKRVWLRGPKDDSGQKNALQSIGSTVAYLERYTYSAVLGISAIDAADDDDGRDSGAKVIEYDEETQALSDTLEGIASEGLRQYAAAWQNLTTEQRNAIGARRHDELKGIARAATRGGSDD